MPTRFFAYILSWKIIRNWQKKFGNYAFLSNQMPQAKFCILLRKKGKVKAHTSRRPKWSELILVSVAWSMPRSIATPPWTGCYSITGLPPSSMSPVPIYTPGWRESKLIRVSCLRKQCNRRGLNTRPPDPELEVLTIRPHVSTEEKNPYKFPSWYCLWPSSSLIYLYLYDFLYKHCYYFSLNKWPNL